MKMKNFFVSVLLIVSMNQCDAIKKEKQMQNTIAENSNEVRPLLPGMLVSAENKRLNQIIEGKYSILIFYRGSWCPYCNLHFSELSKIEKELLALGYTIVAISPDLEENTKLTKEKHGLMYDLYSDSSMQVTRSFGLAYRVDDETVNRYKTHNLDIEAASGETHHLLPAPAVYILSDKGIVLFQYVNPDYKVRLIPELLLAAAKILKESGAQKSPANEK